MSHNSTNKLLDNNKEINNYFRSRNYNLENNISQNNVPIIDEYIELNKKSSLLEKVINKIEKTREKIIQTEELWNEEEYEPISLEHYDNVSKIIQELTYDLISIDITIPLPEVLPCPDGSLNIHWIVQRWELLINFPKDKEGLIDYYGKYFKSNANSIMGKCPENMIKGVIYQWLKRTL